MANNVGIIDSGYRGHLLAKLDCIQEKEEAVIEKHSRLFQVCSPNLLPFESLRYFSIAQRSEPKPQIEKFVPPPA